MKAEEAINTINTWILPLKKAHKSDMASEFFDAVEWLELQAIKYEWHDLRKNPDDLPEEDGEYLCIIEDESSRPVWIDYLAEIQKFGDYELCPHEEMIGCPPEYYFVPCDDFTTVVAWREIEPFEEK